MRVLWLLALLLPADGDREKGKESPLRPLSAVAKHFDKGMAEYLGGTSPAEAWKPWEVQEDRKPELRVRLKAGGVEKATSMGLELFFCFARNGALVYRVETLVLLTPTHVSLFGLKGTAGDGSAPRGIPVSGCKDQTAPFAGAATGFAKAAKTGRPEALPFADPDALRKIVPEATRQEIAAAQADARTRTAEVVAQIAKLDYDEIFVDGDDYYASAFGADGALREGMVRMKLKLKEGVVLLRLNRYETR